MRHVLTVTTMLAFVACSNTQQPDELESSESGLVVDAHDASLFAGHLDHAGQTLRFTFQETDERVFDITYDFGDELLSFVVDGARGAGEFLPTSKTLRESDHLLIERLYQELGTLVADSADERSRVEEMSVRITSLMVSVPTGEALSNFGFQAERGWTHISCSCFNQHIGNGHYRQAGKGDGCTGGSGNGCKGRCGVGCGSDNMANGWTSGMYTQDCAQHDYGLTSWTTASDDYALAPYNCWN